MKKWGWLLCFGFMLMLPFAAQAQNYWSPKARLEFGFGQYDRGNFPTSIQEADSLLILDLSAAERDSALFLSGLSHLKVGNWSEMRLRFQELGPLAGPEAFAFSGIALSYAWLPDSLHKLPSALERTHSVPQNNQLHQLGTYMSCGNSLLLLNYADYDSLRKQQNWANRPKLEFGLAQMDTAWLQYQSSKRKSPFVGGLLAVVLPGAGHAYNKKWGQAVSFLFFSAASGVQAWEGYAKGGPKDPQFIIFASAFAALYTANIFSATLQTKQYNASIETNFRDAILVELALPVESLFERR